MAKLKTIDKIGELNEEIAKLVKKRDRLAATVKDYRGVGTYVGEMYEASVYEQDSTKPNIPKLKKFFGANWHKYLKKHTMVCLRVQKIGSKKRRKAQEIES